MYSHKLQLRQRRSSNSKNRRITKKIIKVIRINDGKKIK